MYNVIYTNTTDQIICANTLYSWYTFELEKICMNCFEIVKNSSYRIKKKTQTKLFLLFENVQIVRMLCTWHVMNTQFVIR